MRTFTVLDMGILKVCLVFFALTLAKLWPGVLALDWYWYGGVFAVSYVWIMGRMLLR